MIYFSAVVGAERFQIIWVIGVRPNQITWVVGYFAAWKGKKEYYLSKTERSFIKYSQKKALSLANRSGNGHFCSHAIVKPRMFPSNIGKNRYRNKLPNSGFCSYKMHFTCRTRSFTNAREQMGNFTPLGLRKIEFYG